ncbi:MAG: hypothetical protein II993_09330 [Anaerotignum sp.]|nr:hypothetical protein [Anaerotignum sp.]MBQ7083916.1 hypothetical protein [Anaerotignum sp.]
MKKNLTKVMAMGMVMTILAGTTAFANETMLISENPNTKSIEEVIAEAEASMYLTQEGTVASVEASETEGVSIVTIDNEQGGLRFAVASNTIIINRQDGFYMTADQLEEGMAVAVVYDMNSPMGMSMPPFLGNVAAVVANADFGSYAVGKFDNELTDMKNMLQLNIDNERTPITNMQGSRIRLTDADVKGQDVLVFYDMMTMSLPAQTNPSFVLILGEQTAPAVSVPLRETAEANGFSVKWQGKAKPILLEKEGVSMELMLDDATFKVNGVEDEAAFATELKDGVMFVSSEIFE